MKIDFDTLAAREAYGWMSGTIYPRPIAWVSTVSAAGETNLAPFSYFQAIASKPPVLMFVPANNRDGRRKDTLRNIEEVPEFVVNLVPHSLGGAMNDTAASLPHGQSEFEKFHVAAAPSERVRPPRVALAPVAFECVLHSIVPIGDGVGGTNVVFGRILLAHVSDSVIGPDGKPDPARLDLIGRMGGDWYARTTDRFVIERP
jgi:flavin reductase (DIM6/NTAB) family NADH-FMN oxidoreductase RutF